MTKIYTNIIKDKSNEIEAEVIRLRRHFHENPEVSLKEKNTSQYIQDILTSLNIPFEVIGEYGIIGVIDTNKPGKTLIMRADMDALPVLESSENLTKSKETVSKIKGVSHTCGHDGHMSILIGAASILLKMKEHYTGKILLCFEQAEETGAGIQDMLKELEKYDADGSWGIHLYSGLDSGKISVAPGPRMSAAAAFIIEVIGEGGHGSRPDKCISPINCAVNIINNLNTAWNSEIDITKTVSLGIGTLNAGSQSNIIPDKATFSGTLRFFDREEGIHAYEVLKRIVEGVAEVNRCKINYIQDVISPFSIINDEKCAKLAEKSVISILGKDYIGSDEPWMASDSMGHYLDRYPGVYAHLGIYNEDVGSGAEHHNPEFDLDESVLKKGVMISCQYALDYLNNK